MEIEWELTLRQVTGLECPVSERVNMPVVISHSYITQPLEAKT